MSKIYSVIRINLNIREEQLEYLKNTSISVAEHYRRAIDEYIDKLKGLNVASSQSKRKEDEQHG